MFLFRFYLTDTGKIVRRLRTSSKRRWKRRPKKKVFRDFVLTKETVGQEVEMRHLPKYNIYGWLICGEWIIADVVVKKEGVTKQLKSDDWLLWIQKTNSIRSRAEEIVLPAMEWLRGYKVPLLH